MAESEEGRLTHPLLSGTETCGWPSHQIGELSNPAVQVVF